MKKFLFAVALLAVATLAGCEASVPNANSKYKVTQYLPDGTNKVWFTNNYPAHNDLLLSFKDAKTGKWVTVVGSYNAEEQ